MNPDTTTMMDAKTGEIPANLTDNIIQEVQQNSAVMSLGKAVPMNKPRERFTFVTGLGAYWVDEGQRIETSKPTWQEAWMNAHKMGVIVPVTKETLSYSVNDFFSLMQAQIAQALYRKFDQASLMGNDNPFAQSVLGSALLAKQTVTETNNKYDDVSNAMAFLEDHDLDANGIAAPRSERRKYRATKDGNGLPIFNSATTNTPADVLGLPIGWAPQGSWDKAKASELLADWNNVYYGILQSINYEVLTEATLTTVKDSNGDPLNLAERDMAAIKATFSPAFMVIKDEATAAIVPSGSTGKANANPARQDVKKKGTSSDATTPDAGSGSKSGTASK